MEKNSCIEILKSNYLSRVERNRKYSLRAFARDIGISSSRLSELFNDKGRLSEQSAKIIMDRLNLTSTEKEIFLALVIREFSKSKKKQEQAVKLLSDFSYEDSFRNISVDGFKLIADWYHFAVLTVMELDSYDGTIEFISKKLFLDINTIEKAINRLIRLDLVELTAGKFNYTGSNISTSHDVYSPALRKSHKTSLQQGIEALDTVPLELRDITSMMVAIDETKIPEAKKMITRFRRRLTKFLEEGKKTKAYQINIQFIPLNTGREDYEN